MDYNSLVASKGTPGSILNWAGYSKMDAPTLLAEAEGLLYQFLRTREMRQEWAFTVPAGWGAINLPLRFLDPIGKIFDTNGVEYPQNIESMVKQRRAFDDIAPITLQNNPFTTGLAGYGVLAISGTGAQGVGDIPAGSTITIAGSTAVDGIPAQYINATHVVYESYPTADICYINVLDGQATTGTTVGGGSNVTIASGKSLITGQPTDWAIWNEQVQFDAAFDTDTVCRLNYYRLPNSLSATVPTNFVTIRYPRLLRAATNAAAIDFMKDNGEYQKAIAALQALIQQTVVGDDFSYRGASFGTENP